MINNKGFTLVELIVCISILLIISGIFSINFIKNLNDTKNNEYNDLIKNIESAADAYVMTYKDTSSNGFDDIKSVISKANPFCYIPIEEIIFKGFLSEDLTNPKTGNPFSGLIKFSVESNNEYEFEYIENIDNYISIIYVNNGADSISRKFYILSCDDMSDKTKIATCAQDYTLPDIIDSQERQAGWATDINAIMSSHLSGSSLQTFLKEENYEIIDNKILVYAILF